MALFAAMLWMAFIDGCCNVLGSNANGAVFFDAASDALKQVQYFAGRDSVINPPFDMCLQFIDLIKNALKLD